MTVDSLFLSRFSIVQMGQAPVAGGMKKLSNNFIFSICKSMGHLLFTKGAASPADNWRFVIKTMSLENRALKINRDHYNFSKELGEGAFGSVYSARQLSNSQYNKYS